MIAIMVKLRANDNCSVQIGGLNWKFARGQEVEVPKDQVKRYPVHFFRKIETTRVKLRNNN